MHANGCQKIARGLEEKCLENQVSRIWAVKTLIEGPEVSSVTPCVSEGMREAPGATWAMSARYSALHSSGSVDLERYISRRRTTAPGGPWAEGTGRETHGGVRHRWLQAEAEL